MKRMNIIRIGTAMLAAATLGWAQDAPAQGAASASGQSELSAPSAQSELSAPSTQAQVAPAPSAPSPSVQSPDGWRRLGAPAAGQTAPGQYNAPQPNNPPPPPPLPATLTIAPGTFFTIRVNQALSTNHNKVGDVFTASLASPIIVNGVVVAERGQTLAGRVAEINKAGLLKGSSKLGIQLTELTLIDGSQSPLHSQLVSLTGPGSGGRNAAVVGGTTIVGAGLGAAIGSGTATGAGAGAAIGAGAGAAAGLIGVLAAKGYPAIIPPEAVLTFRVEEPIVVATDRAPQAFRYAGPADYGQPVQPRLMRRPPPYYGAGYYPYPYAYPYYGPYYGWGYPYYGPGIGIGIGVGGRWR